jgi:uncharacterized protein YfbU (UPF0304 family)
MTLSDGEKLILVMLSEIYRSQGIKGEIDPDFVMASIFNDKLWGLKWQYGGLFNAKDEDPPEVRETCDILDMFRLLTPSYDKLSASDKKRVQTEAHPFGSSVKFEGFDANNDPHYGISTHLVGQLKRYDEVPLGLNSHSSASLGRYRRMLKAYRPLLADGYPREGLTADQIIMVLTAGLPPR